MGERTLQEEIDAVSVILYQNREQEALEQIGPLFGKLKAVSDALLQTNEDREQIEAFVSEMYKVLLEAYRQKDLLGMADCLQEKVTLAVELYQIKFQAGK